MVCRHLGEIMSRSTYLELYEIFVDANVETQREGRNKDVFENDEEKTKETRKQSAENKRREKRQ
jgi:hypothetical protein